MAAARKAEVGESTLRRWLREDEHFQMTLRRFREQALTHASLRLQQNASRAVESMIELISSKDRIEAGRTSIARTLLDFAFRAGAHGDLADHIADLEKVAPDDKKK